MHFFKLDTFFPPALALTFLLFNLVRLVSAAPTPSHTSLSFPRPSWSEVIPTVNVSHDELLLNTPMEDIENDRGNLGPETNSRPKDTSASGRRLCWLMPFLHRCNSIQHNGESNVIFRESQMQTDGSGLFTWPTLSNFILGLVLSSQTNWHLSDARNTDTWTFDAPWRNNSLYRILCQQLSSRWNLSESLLTIGETQIDHTLSSIQRRIETLRKRLVKIGLGSSSFFQIFSGLDFLEHVSVLQISIPAFSLC